MRLHKPDLAIGQFESLAIDGTEYRNMERISSDTFSMEKMPQGTEMEFHIDQLTDMVRQASEVTLSKQ